MIITVTPDPALTHTWTVPDLTLGRHNSGAQGNTRAGGNGVDVSRILCAYGYESVAVTTAGGPTGSVFSADLATSGIPNRIVPVNHPTRSCLELVTMDGAALTAVDQSRSQLTASEADSLVETVLRIPGPEIVALCGPLPAGFHPSHVADLVSRIKAEGSVALVNVSGASLIAAARVRADVLTANETEISTATGIDNPLAAAQLLVDAGARAVLVTTASNDVIVATATQSVSGPLTLPNRGADSPGTGATFIAAACGQLLHDSDPDLEIFRVARQAVLAPDPEPVPMANLPHSNQRVAATMPATLPSTLRQSRAVVRRSPATEQMIVHHAS